ncbi:unnamed protein product [Lepeophtheirus salmonis]|uniref:(salmon louse) hypothetical protein n=1 Tax=Lepeophtheirus salmonis TaxID=72036 RepID=A0A817FCQ6_LEPSM|nr:unnamed protein product [Lepeophtheirus salmonis]CAG9477395.1 unnamed protein product [Lepeophtheirus salmonis]
MDDQDRDPRKDCGNMDDLDLSFDSDEENIRPITSKPPKSVVSLEEPLLPLILANLKKGAKEGGEESPVIRGEQAGNFIEGKYRLGKDQHDELEPRTVNRELRRLEEWHAFGMLDKIHRVLRLSLRPVLAAMELIK